MDDSIRTAKYTPLNYHYSRVCLVCGETERYSSPTTATIVDTSIPWLCDRCRETLLKLIEDANTSNALNALEQENKESKEELTDTNVGKWIPVTERLPEEDGRYLTVYWLGTIPNTPWIKTAWFAKNLRNVDKYDFPKKKPGFYDSDSEYGYFEITGVTHWMPLPEPPKEE